MLANLNNSKLFECELQAIQPCLLFNFRALYYQYTNFVKKPEQINSALLAISRILDVGPWELRIFNTNKGLVYGDLKMICEDGEIVNCNAAVAGAAI